MVLAAGLGTRMRPLTDTCPKPLIKVAGKPLIEYGFDRLHAAGVRRAIVNVHHLPTQIEEWARKQRGIEILISDERTELLDTGGGVARALPRLGDAPFFVLNSDSFWIDIGTPALSRLISAWDDSKMDCLLLLCPISQTIGYDGLGDFVIEPGGMIARRDGSTCDGLAYAGSYLVAPRLFLEAPAGKFSMNVLWDRAIARNRLFGLTHWGKWFHVGTPDAIPSAERALFAT
ncbi:MAG: nucleotidyltransferase family protein [Alphaproteobacteria bacterium]|nr:nucleotidyltransferase family protein [Alphaproteobacteria bacterium]